MPTCCDSVPSAWLNIRWRDAARDRPGLASRRGELQVLHRPLRHGVSPGRLDSANAAYVLDLLREGCLGCLDGRYQALVTAPVHKGVINDAGIAFSGHTETLAEWCDAWPVMMLATRGLRVALATTHLPLREVPDAITEERLERVIRVLFADLRRRFGIARPRLLVAGLNPHAGEGGHLGTEEQRLMTPLFERLRGEGLDLSGPWSADTLFTPERIAASDAILAMYHDQGLPVLKHLGFGRSVNVTLGLPIVRTSVDHGTALELAATGKASAESLFAAVEMALEMTRLGPDAKPV
jgi:4-hydroxythreonine-4-phosphate dehydrogenase